MSFAAVLLTPFVLLFPAAGVIELHDPYEVPYAAMGENPPPRPDMLPGGSTDTAKWVFGEVAETFRVQAQNQVRIEQHMSIRITPLSRPMPVPRPMIMDLPGRELAPRMIERNMGRCVAVSNISGVQPDNGGRLILFLRDRRMVSAVLERACRARDFYSGFYIERTNDGQLCVDRDTLLSRSGANCKLTRIRQLVDADE
ncbi:MAG TPA: hypothetical protein VF481_11095 [Novosphingobium sp.]